MKMISAPAPARFDSAAQRIAPSSFDDSQRGQSARLLDGELFDLYCAILIVVPVAVFLKSLWF
jgi:hypothetical protein